MVTFYTQFVLEKHKEDIVDFGETLTGTQNELIIPKYMDINFIEVLHQKNNNHLNKKLFVIIGIASNNKGELP